MRILRISYDLLAPGRDYQDLFEAIRKVDPDAIRVQYSAWFAATSIAPAIVAAALRLHVDANDRLDLTELGNEYWTTDRDPSVLNWLGEHGIRVVQIDLPTLVQYALADSQARHLLN